MASPSPRHQHSGNTAVTSRRVILAAFGLSLLIHGALALMPGWLLPDDSAFEMPPLRASLRTAPQPATAAPPRQPAVRRAPRPAAQPAENPPQGAAAPATPAGPPEPEPAASEPAARDEAAPANVQAGAPEPAAEPAAPTPVASDLPPEGRLNFAVSRGDGMSDIAESVHGWQHDGVDYVVKSRVAGLGLFALAGSITMESHGKLTPRGLQPERFEGRKRNNPTETALFDRAAGLLRLAGRDRTKELALPPDTQDLASVWYQLAWQQDAEFSLWICNGRSVVERHFSVRGQENFASRVGNLRVLHLESRAAPGEDAYEVWLALDHHRLPVRIRQTNRKGETYEQQVKDMQYPGVHLAEAAAQQAEAGLRAPD